MVTYILLFAIIHINDTQAMEVTSQQFPTMAACRQADAVLRSWQSEADNMTRDSRQHIVRSQCLTVELPRN